MHRTNRRSGHWATKPVSVLALALVLSIYGSQPTALLAAAAATGREKPKRATVKVIVIDGTQRFPIYVMRTKGIADKYNLSVEEIPVSGPQAQYTTMQTGDFQVATTAWFPIVLMRAQGFKFNIVFPVSSYTDDIVVRADSPLKTMADLKGKRIGISGGPASSGTWIFRTEAVRFFEFDPMKESRVQFGAAPLLIGLLENNELDAVLIQNPQVVRLLETKKFRSLASFGDIWREKTGQDVMLVTIVMNEEWAKANRDIAKRFVAAFKESAEYLKAHAEVWPEISEQIGIKTETGAKLLRERTAKSLLTRWDKKLLDEQYRYGTEVMKIFGDSEGIPKQIPPDTFDMSFTP
ncbi:MAG: ABC transporter substrate-binding protein [Deltaproteobacteria bacterium]|jgi:NitT/TauT family transport system substrate-binding protein